MINRWTPKGGVKISDKNSDAVAYLYDSKGKPGAVVYVGKQSKPYAWYTYDSAAKRAERVAYYFQCRQQAIALKAEQAAKRKAKGRGVELGQYLVASWGYEQTNINFYKVTKLIGQTMAEVTAVGQIDVGSSGGSSMSTKVIPAEDPAPGAKVYRVQVKDGRATVNGQRASTWDGKPEYCSWYA